MAGGGREVFGALMARAFTDPRTAGVYRTNAEKGATWIVLLWKEDGKHVHVHGRTLIEAIERAEKYTDAPGVKYEG